MVDREVRAAEREGVAASLRQRVRVGFLPQERLRLAALLGYEPAVVALGERPQVPPVHASLESLESWVEVIGCAGPEAVVRAALAAATGAAHHFDILFQGSAAAGVLAGCLAAAERYLSAPSPEQSDRVVERIAEAQAILGGLTHAGRVGDPNPPHTSALESAILAAAAAISPEPRRSAAQALWYAAATDAVRGSIAPHAIEALSDRVGEELVRWALEELGPSES